MARKNRAQINGGIPLRGEVLVSGSKNSALPCLFATLLTSETSLIDNVPQLDDINTTCSLLTVLGKKVTQVGHQIKIEEDEELKTNAPYDLVRRMRASILVLGPLLARYGKAQASLPGGCAIGNRPINIHIEGLMQLGAQSKLAEGIILLSSKGLKGKKITLSFPSVGATENLLMASSLSRGKTILKNCAKEPEIVDLADCLKFMGAKISGAGSATITIHGQSRLHGAKHKVIPDRIESATYLIAAAATKGDLTLIGTESKHIHSIISCLKKTGCRIEIKKGNPETIRCKSKGIIKPVNIVTGPFPGFPTDVQAQIMTLMALANGKSTIKETIFENRYLHAAELNRMGAKIEIFGNKAVITGVPQLSGADVMVSDLRAGAALLIAGLASKGKSVIHRLYHLDRGYENFESKFLRVGAEIRRY